MKGVSLWLDQVGPQPRRPPLSGDTTVDVVVVGAGYTGLWTALYLRRLAPDLRVTVVEANHVGYGASGRNGGWCLGELAAPEVRWDAAAGPGGARRMHEAMVDTLDEIQARCLELGIDCDWNRSGAVYLARNGGQERRLRAEVRGDLRWLEPSEATAMVGATSIRGALFDPHVATLHPGKLVVGLGRACEEAGVAIHEGTTAMSVEPGLVRTDHGTVRAENVVLATEAYTISIPGRSRDLVPFYSLMIATEPLDDALLARVGLIGRPAFNDTRYRVIYGQRTADGRLAFGGRAASYRWGSRIDFRVEQDPAAHRMVHQTLLELFPFLADVAITHRWGGVLGVPRNWTPTVGLDRGVYRAGGYIGEGVGAANLAGRSLAHLIVGTGHDLTTLPWVRRPSRRWPVEPFRWLGIMWAAALLDRADRHEAVTDRPSRSGGLVWRYLRR